MQTYGQSQGKKASVYRAWPQIEPKSLSAWWTQWWFWKQKGIHVPFAKESALWLRRWGHKEGFRSGHLTVYFSGCEVRKSEPARKQLALCRSHSCCAALHTRHTRLWDRTPGVQPHTWGEPLMLLFVVRSYWCYLSLCKFYVDSYLVANFYCLITKGRTRDAFADVTVFPEAPCGYFQKPLFSVAFMLVISGFLPTAIFWWKID